MCGIAGYTCRAGTGVDERLIRRMTGTLERRGPDAEGYLLDGPVALGHRRLKIIDLEGGAQPLANEDGAVWVSFNGEIYNFADLREELEARGHRFRTRSDTEAIVHAYEEYGADCFRRFNGMFALAIWDRRRGALLLARDRIGKKPLYYAEIGGELVFGSELKALREHPDVSGELDLGALHRFLAFEFVPAPYSIYRDVRKLAPAHYLEWTASGVKVERYWRMEYGDCPYPTLAAAAEELRARLGAAVRRRLVSDVPLGVLLSGGIDSSAVTAFAARETSRLRTFSIGFEERSFDESRFARQVAECFGTEHTEACFSTAELLALIPEVFAYLDEPFADPSVLPTYLLCRHTRAGVTVALGGDGGDELFMGYPTFDAVLHAARFGRLPRWMRRGVRSAVDHLPASTRRMSAGFLARQFLKGLDYPPPVREQVWLGAFAREEQAQLLSGDARQSLVVDDPYIELVREVAAAGAPTPVDAAAYHHLRYYLADGVLAKVDRASMANSLEVRAPLLDPEIIDFAARIPSAWNLGEGGKRVLKRALAPLLPPAILHRRKQGFGIPLTAWLRRELVPLCDELLDPTLLRRQGIFDPSYAGTLLREHRAGLRDHRKPLWTLLAFQLWWRGEAVRGRYGDRRGGGGGVDDRSRFEAVARKSTRTA